MFTFNIEITTLVIILVRISDLFYNLIFNFYHQLFSAIIKIFQLSYLFSKSKSQKEEEILEDLNEEDLDDDSILELEDLVESNDIEDNNSEIDKESISISVSPDIDTEVGLYGVPYNDLTDKEKEEHLQGKDLIMRETPIPKDHPDYGDAGKYERAIMFFLHKHKNLNIKDFTARYGSRIKWCEDYFSKAWLAGVLDGLTGLFKLCFNLDTNSKRRQIGYLILTVSYKNRSILTKINSEYLGRIIKLPETKEYQYILKNQKTLVRFIKDIVTEVKSPGLRETLKQVVKECEFDIEVSDKSDYLMQLHNCEWFSGLIDGCGTFFYDKNSKQIELHLESSELEFLEKINRHFPKKDRRLITNKDKLEMNWDRTNMIQRLHISEDKPLPFIWIMDNEQVVLILIAEYFKHYPLTGINKYKLNCMILAMYLKRLNPIGVKTNFTKAWVKLYISWKKLDYYSFIDEE
jgi:hypothetical protein